MKVLFGTPTTGSPRIEWCASVMQMFDHEARKGDARLLHLNMKFQKGAYISKNRNEITLAMYAEDCDAVLMIDHDQSFPPDILECMVEAMERTGRGVIAGNVALQKGAHTTGFVAEGDIHRSVMRERNEPETHVDTIAASCVLVHRRIFDKISQHLGSPGIRTGPPWFGPGVWWMLTPVWDDKREVWLERGEDFSFSWRVREIGEAPMLLLWNLGIKHFKVSCIEARTEVAA